MVENSQLHYHFWILLVQNKPSDSLSLNVPIVLLEVFDEVHPLWNSRQMTSLIALCGTMGIATNISGFDLFGFLLNSQLVRKSFLLV